MGKKTKLGKGRLDKYYHIAKQQGYRSRACFKLIQINKKYQFLNKANAVIDLCAAPGGWLQVCEKFCPYGALKLGVDLDRIQPIPGCKTFVNDITTPECYSVLKKEMAGKKADAVLNDGAPNVGQNWSKDAFAQIELTLSALKLACNFLKKGGVFVTKVFRSTDYNALVYVMKKFFKRVEANKPLASRFASAEIFVVCLDFIAPDFIDEQLFDAKVVFRDTEYDLQTQQVQTEINSVDKIMEKRRKRTGYADDAPMMLSKTLQFQEFLDVENPFAVFVTHQKMTQPSEELKNMVEPPKFFDEYLDDLQVIGKREITALIKWRGKLRQKIKFSKKEEETKDKAEMSEEEDEIEELKNVPKQGDEEDNEEDNEDDEDEEEDDEDDNEEEQIRKLQKRELNEQRKQLQRKNKVITSYGTEREFAGHFDDEELFNLAEHKNIKKMEYIDTNEGDAEPKINKIRMTKKDIEQNLENLYEQNKNKMGKKAKLLGNATNDLEKGLNDDKLKCNTMEEEDDVNKISKRQEKAQLKKQIESKTWFDRDVFKGLGGIENDDEQIVSQSKGQTFVNPITGHRFQQIEQGADEQLTDEDLEDEDMEDEDDDEEDYEDVDEEEEEDDQKSNSSFVDVGDDFNEEIYIDKKLLQKRKRAQLDENAVIDQNETVKGEKMGKDEYKLDVPMSDMAKRRLKMGKASKRSEKKKAKETEVHELNQPIEFVPEQKIEDYDLDTLATTMAMAKKMLRNRSREAIIDSTYSRYANEDQDDLPVWFTEDEERHNFKHIPVTKEDIKAEMDKIKAINNKAPKKVLEAKIRKQKRLEKKMKKANTKANEIFEQEGVSEKMKIVQAKKLYAKQYQQVNQDKKKKVVVANKNRSGKVNQNSKSTTYTDARCRKDVKNQRYNKGDSKKKSSTQTGNGGRQPSRKRQVHRKKRK